MDFPRLVFRSPGSEQCQGGTYSHALVSDDDGLKAMIADGWHRTLPDALAPPPVMVEAVIEKEDDSAPPTRAELRRKAKELGLSVRHSTTDNELAQMIADKLAGE